MSNTLNLGNGKWARKKGSLLAYNSENNNYKPLPFTFDRNSVATRVNKQGLIETVGADQPRIDYLNDSNGALLLEPQSTNLYLYSEPTTNEGSAGGVTYESFNWAIGFTNCVKYGDNSAVRYRYGGTVLASTEYTLSAFVIMDDLSEPIIGGQTSDKDFSLVLGGSVVNPNSSVNMGNNIWRFSSTAITSASPNVGNNGIIKYTQQSNKGFRVVGWQLEAGSYATSYIPTAGSTVTRLGETANNAGDVNVFNSEEGVLYAEIAALANDGTYKQFTLNSGTPNDSVRLMYTDIDNQIRYFVRRSASTQADITHTLTDATQFCKIAMVYKVNDFQLWVNGIKVGTDTNGTPPSGLSTIDFNDGGTSSYFYGKVKNVKVFNKALTDRELEILTIQ